MLLRLFHAHRRTFGLVVATIAVATILPVTPKFSEESNHEAINFFDGLSINILTTQSKLPNLMGASDGLSTFSCNEYLDTSGLLMQGVERDKLLAAKLPNFMWELYRKLGNVDGGSSVISDPGTLGRLHFLATFLDANMTVETGFANGASALALLSAKVSHNNPIHIAFDPYQKNFFHRGLEYVQTYFDENESNKKFVHVNESGAIGLAHLVRAHSCVDLMFMDDGHKFDDNMVELYHATRLLKIGGILVMHDADFPSVQHAANFAMTNLGFQPILTASEVGAYFLLKSRADDRCWYDFTPFCNKSLAQTLPFTIGTDIPCV